MYSLVYSGTYLLVYSLTFFQFVHKLRIQGHMHILGETNGNRALILNSESTQQIVTNRTCSSSVGAFCVELWTKQVSYRNSVPTSYINSLLRLWRSSCRQSGRAGLRWRCPRICNTFASGRPQVNLRLTWKSTSSAQVAILTHNKRDVAIY